MNNLVSESLNEYVSHDTLNELDPQAIQAASFIAGGIGVLLSATGIAYLQNALKKSDSKAAQKLGKILAGLGKGAADGTKKGPSTTLGESSTRKNRINEMADPALMDLATYVGGALGIVLSAGGITVLMDKLQKSKDPKAKKFAKILAKLGKGASSGTSKAPATI